MIRTLNFFQKASDNPPASSGFYLAYCEDKMLRILFYNAKIKTWTTEDIGLDPALACAFDRKVLAWSNLIGTQYALSQCDFS